MVGTVWARCLRAAAGTIRRGNNKTDHAKREHDFMTRGMFASFGNRAATAGATLAAWAGASSGAFAQEQFIGAPRPGQMGLPEPVTSIAREINFAHDVILLPIITVICLFVLGLLIYAMSKFSEKNNPVPTTTTHNAAIEVAWTVVPVLILIFIAAFTFPLLTRQLVIPKADHVIKVTGNSGWTWTWNYPVEEGGGFEFVQKLLPQEDLPAGKLKLLDVDNEAVVPVNKVIKVQVTADAAGIIHSFAIPSFGVRIDAVPGRLNETWFKAEREGIYYGQCSKLCGKDHAYMPSVIRVVSEEKYKEWLAQARKQFGEAPAGAQRFAATTR
jgi:cytochrome c oxidase subunit II